MNYTTEDIDVLIVSKDEEEIRLLTEGLQNSGLSIKQINAVPGISEARNKYKKYNPSVVFFDAGHDEKYSEKFTALYALNPAVPVIVLIGKHHTQSAYDLLEKGASDFIRKGNYEFPVLKKTVHFSIKAKHTAESLRLSNERYELVSKATNDMVWDWDLANNKVFRSAEGWEDLFGKSDNDQSIYSDSWWDRIHPDDKEKANQILENVLNDTHIQYFEIECRMLRNDNSYATVIDRGYAVRNKAGEVTRLIGATQDITAKKALEEEMKKRSGRELRERQNEITNAVITAQEHEREELGKELHDNINQILATAKLYIEYSFTNEEMSKGLLQSAKGFIEVAVAELRSLSKSLLPPSLGEVGLVMALNELIESLLPVNKFTISTHFRGIEEDKISEQLKLTVFRIIQEQLNNISKHAKAKRVWIRLINNQDKFEIRIRDNGKGFDYNKKVSGVGLKNIFSRAQLHNGKAEIISEIGKGCTLTVLFKKKEIDEKIYQAG